jgi:glycosyltransferase involved in cell wall biosynthesis
VEDCQVKERDGRSSSINRLDDNDSTLCAFGLIFAPLREMVFLADAQRKNVRRKALNLGLKIKSMPQVSVIIPTHNRPHLLPRAVESALGAGTDVEVIVVDDASTDETASVCRNFSHIRYVRVERNRQVAGARNLGLLAAGAKYISFLDDDDQRLPQSLDLQIKALSSVPEAAFCYGQVLVSDQRGATDGSFYPKTCPQGDVFWKLLERNFIPCGSVVFRKSCLYRVGLLEESIPGIDDWDLWIRLAEIYRVVAIEQPVAIWRKPVPGSGQGSSETLDLIRLSARELRRRWLALPRAALAPPEERREVWRRFSKNLAEHLAWETASALASGQLRRAGRLALAQLRLHPSGLFAVTGRWARPSTLRALLAGARGSSDDMEEIKTRFKQMRLSRSKQ